MSRDSRPTRRPTVAQTPKPEMDDRTLHMAKWRPDPFGRSAASSRALRVTIRNSVRGPALWVVTVGSCATSCGVRDEVRGINGRVVRVRADGGGPIALTSARQASALVFLDATVGHDCRPVGVLAPRATLSLCPTTRHHHRAGRWSGGPTIALTRRAESAQRRSVASSSRRSSGKDSDVVVVDPAQ